MSWQITEARKRKSRTQGRRRVYVSINKRGEISMNERAWSVLTKPATVTLLYDAERRSIGVKFPVMQDRHFFPVRKHGRRGRTLVVRAHRLIKQFDIQIHETLVFNDPPIERIDVHPMLVLNLPTAKARIHHSSIDIHNSHAPSRPLLASAARLRPQPVRIR